MKKFLIVLSSVALLALVAVPGFTQGHRHWGGGPGGMGGPGMMGGAAAPQRKGVDARTKDRAKDAAAAVKAVKSATTSSLHDPYFYIVEVKIYGQARFFNPPPVEAPARFFRERLKSRIGDLQLRKIEIR